MNTKQTQLHLNPAPLITTSCYPDNLITRRIPAILGFVGSCVRGFFFLH